MKGFFTPKRIIIGSILIVVAVVFYFHATAFMPFILATVTAFLLDPLIAFVQKHLKIKKRVYAVTIVFILFVLFLALLFYFIITKLISETIGLVERIPGYIFEISRYLEQLLENFNETVAQLPPVIIDELEKQTASLLEWASTLTQKAIPLLVGWVQGIPNLVIVFIIYLLALFLISLDLPKYKEGFFARFEKENAEKVRFMLHRATRFFSGFFKAQFLVSIIIFIVSYIGLLIIAPDKALVMAFVIWFIDFIPIIGSIVILAPWGLFELLSGETGMAIELFILAGVLLIIRRTVEPKVMGDQIGLPALPTLIGLWLGLYFFGFIGLIIGPLIIIALYSAKEAGLIKFDFKI
ncbi:sporulation integral membrane protein YtvI [Fervidibacillus halotolerans]|uniref:Sporulation integral membrane protein YtvI n=1 Tax=Fervidibacillus halotolerans TaxID=2980027 RepID=A0A9E8M1B2_9BACI|nr:sporulation integral membrane protein YtvI [Fervidibacillus halotolerans]WAA12474.1 sporulation integral membrane protein YtvI [Fervidibacillus halotolerans]